MAKSGPKKLDRAPIVERLIPYLEDCVPIRQACKAAGCCYETMRSWINGDAALLALVKKAQSAGREKRRADCERAIMLAATRPENPAWQAAAWWLERNYPERYAQRTKQQVEAKITGGKSYEEIIREAIDGDDGK